MTVERVLVARIRCGHLDDHGRCPSLLHVDVEINDDQVRAAARERGWGQIEPRMQGGPVFGGSGTPDFPVQDDERDRCPRHREQQPTAASG